MPDGLSRSAPSRITRLENAVTKRSRRLGLPPEEAREQAAAEIGVTLAELRHRVACGEPSWTPEFVRQVDAWLASPAAAGGEGAAAPAPMSKCDHALAHARAGFSVFPLIDDGKRPRFKGWQEWATRDAAKIRERWARTPDANIGIATEKFGDDGGALLAVDIDNKNGKSGDETFAQLIRDGSEFPDTLEHATPNKGRHLGCVLT